MSRDSLVSSSAGTGTCHVIYQYSTYGDKVAACYGLDRNRRINNLRAAGTSN
jgi:hypothetical protein